MDSLRETPDNIPNRELITRYLGRPLTEVPDPFEEYESFATHNNAHLRKLLDGFGYDYEFASSTAFYKSGRFDAALRLMLRRFEAVQEIMQPSLREERAATYSPFLPIHPRTRVVMQVPFIGVDPTRGPYAGRILRPARNSRRPSPAAVASCNGSLTGLCAGMRFPSITRWRARTSSIRSSSARRSPHFGGRAARRLQLRALPR
jgi:lysyl-tRNA synthetase, class I